MFAGLIRRLNSNGVHGRALWLPGRKLTTLSVQCLKQRCQVELRKWDRLEIGGSIMRDLHCTINELLSSNNDVVDLRFWRQGTSHNFSHISPIMEVAGFQFEYVMIDTLHTIDLGVGPRLAGVALQRILQHGKCFQNNSSELGMALGCSELTAALARWKTGPGVAQRLCRSYNFKTFKLKTLSKGHLKAKGMQCRVLLPFVRWLLMSKKCKGVPHRLHMLRAISSLCQALACMRSANFSPARLGALLEIVHHSSVKASVPLLPKFHMSRHLAQLSMRAGSPESYSCYRDESHNRNIVTMAKANPFTLSKAVLLREAWRLQP